MSDHLDVLSNHTAQSRIDKTRKQESGINPCEFIGLDTDMLTGTKTIYLFIQLGTSNMLEQASKQKDLKQWYLKYIDYFREKYEKLSTDEKTGMNNTNNFLNPCQIESFWLDNPDYQLVVLSNFTDRPDKEIIINGPYVPHEFHSKIIPILKEERWMRKVKENLPRKYGQFETLGEKMALEIYRFVETSKLCPFMLESRDHRELQGMAIENTWIRFHVGNVGELDYIQEINQIIQSIKQNAKFKQNQKLAPTAPVPFSDAKFTGFGVHMFPPIIIGSESKRSIEELVYNLSNQKFSEKVFDMKINNKQIIVNKDGFIFIEDKNQENALKILNLIMACGAFYGFSLHAVREHELVQADYDTKDLSLGSMQWNAETRRADLMDNSFNFQQNRLTRKTPIKLELMQELLSNTRELLKQEKLSEDMRLFNEGLTHFANSEFAPSFIMSWSVIERHHSDLWSSLLSQRNIDQERLSKLNNTNQWTIDYVLEVLELQNHINENSYDLLMELKRKRNKFYHNGKQVTKDDADRCLQYARVLLADKIGQYIHWSDNLMLSKKS